MVKKISCYIGVISTLFLFSIVPAHSFPFTCINYNFGSMVGERVRVINGLTEYYNTNGHPNWVPEWATEFKVVFRGDAINNLAREEGSFIAPNRSPLDGGGPIAYDAGIIQATSTESAMTATTNSGNLASSFAMTGGALTPGGELSEGAIAVIDNEIPKTTSGIPFWSGNEAGDALTLKINQAPNAPPSVNEAGGTTLVSMEYSVPGPVSNSQIKGWIVIEDDIGLTFEANPFYQGDLEITDIADALANDPYIDRGGNFPPSQPLLVAGINLN